MQDTPSQTPQNPAGALPDVNAIKASDIAAALKSGLSDFAQAPIFGLFFGGIMAIGGFTILYILMYLEQRWWILPAAFGFPLIGPFAAIGLYEVSRRLERGEKLVWGESLTTVFDARKGQLPWIGFAVLFIFWIWMYQVRTLIALVAGLSPFATLSDFTSFIKTTEGALFLGVGSVVGAFMALALFAVTVIGIPLLLDRDVDFMTAVLTSIKTVFASPAVMLCWGLFTTIMALIGIATGFFGLFLLFPILGHATWHLYRRAVP